MSMTVTNFADRAAILALATGFAVFRIIEWWYP